MTSEKMKRPKALLLDFYGTLVEEDHGPIKAACRQIADAAKKPVDPLELYAEWWATFSKICTNSHGENFLLEREIEIKTIEILLKRYNADFNSEEIEDKLYHHWEHPEIFPDTNKFIEDCDVPICIVSNVDNDPFYNALKHTKLSFDLIVTSEDCKSYKPRPETFDKALTLLGMSNEEVIHIGDSLYTDVAGAKALGIRTLWIDNRGNRIEPEEPKPDYIAPTIRGVIDILNARARE